MNHAKIVAFAIAIAVVCGLAIAQQISMKRRLKSRLASRERVPASEFGSRYYTDTTKADIATFILQRIEEITGFELAGALPGDRWTEDLHIDELDSLVSVEIVQEVERRFGIRSATLKQCRSKHSMISLSSWFLRAPRQFPLFALTRIRESNASSASSLSFFGRLDDIDR